MVFLSLGTNIGNKEQNLLEAISKINKQIGNVVSQSAFFATAPWGFESHNQFLNACLGVKTLLSPSDLLDQCQAIEKGMGRQQKSKRTTDADGKETIVYHDRIIDIDILLYDDRIVQTRRLTIPHPLMHKRRFVLEPLAEIAYDVKIPGTEMSVGEMLNELAASE
jgi:2-amino-4-hydroxy-6-hydroxymethyldihydropteridine diphosphokinase